MTPLPSLRRTAWTILRVVLIGACLGTVAWVVYLLFPAIER